MTVRTEPCSWPIEYGPTPVPEAYGAQTAAAKTHWEALASTLLWRWTGRVLGLCSEIVRPATVPPVENNGWPQFRWASYDQPLLGPDDCHTQTTIPLPGPVDSIVEILLDGAVLPPSSYRVDNHGLLVRTDGGSWPLSQRYELPTTAVGTFEVVYRRGVPIPYGGRVAAGILAIEMWKSAANVEGCQLPRRVQTVTRQGVTVAAMLDTFDDLDRGHTGIYSVDSWLASMIRPPVSSRVYSPDLSRARTTSWQG